MNSKRTVHAAGYWLAVLMLPGSLLAQSPIAPPNLGSFRGVVADRETQSANAFRSRTDAYQESETAQSSGLANTPSATRDSAVVSAAWQQPQSDSIKARFSEPSAADQSGAGVNAQPSDTENPSLIHDGEVVQASSQTPMQVATTTDSKTSTRPKLPLGKSDKKSAGEVERPANDWIRSLLSMLTSLMIVLAVFLTLAWVLKRAKPKSSQQLPREVLQVLGTSQLGPRNSLYMLRVGPKLVLVSAGSGDVQTVTEITDPIEVDRLCGQCEAAGPNSLSQSFRTVLRQVADSTAMPMVASRKPIATRKNPTTSKEEVSPAVALLAKEQRR